MTSLDRMIPTLVHIQTHLDDDLKLERLARVAGVTPSHFSRSFTATIGESPHAYVERLRLERAAVLLVVRAASVLEIALDLGFQSHETFTWAFSRDSASPHVGGATAPGPSWPPRTPMTGAVDPWPRSCPKGPFRRRRSGRCAGRPFSSNAMSARTTKYRPPCGVACRLRPLVAGSRPRARCSASPTTPPGYRAGPLSLRRLHRRGGTVAAAWRSTNGVGAQFLPGGPFATTRYVGPYSGLAQAYSVIVDRIVTRTPRVELVGLPAIESYHTTVINLEASLNETEIALPVRIGGVEPAVQEEP